MADPTELPQLSANDLVELAWNRLTEWYITDTRTYRIGNRDTLQWKQRIRDNDALYRGDWATVFPDETTKVDLPRIQNLYQVATDEMARLSAETKPFVRAPVYGKGQRFDDNARLREAIMRTYWVKGRGDILIPQLTQDLVTTGTAFLACVPPANPGEYPAPYRLDPRACYPDVVNGNIQDVVALQRVRARQAEMILGVDLSSWAGDYKDIEIIDYYHPYGIVRVLTAVANNEPVGTPMMFSRIKMPLGCAPLAFAMLPTADGHFRGMFDQTKGVMATLNRLVTLTMDYADQGIYAPFFEFDVENWTEQPGPKTVYHGLNEKSEMKRVEPAIASPQLYQAFEFIEDQARYGLALPKSRQGEVDQSQASGEFVNSSQGSMVTQVRAIQSLLADLRMQWNSIALQIDDTSDYADEEKPLARPSNGVKTYVPSKAIKGLYDNEVQYGAGAGLDSIQRNQIIFEEVGAGLMSDATARLQMEDIWDPEYEERQIEKETVVKAALQKLLNEEGTSQLTALIQRMADGKDVFDSLADMAKSPAPLPAGQPEPNTPEGMAAQPPEGGAEAPPAGEPGAAPAGGEAAAPPFTVPMPSTAVTIGG